MELKSYEVCSKNKELGEDGNLFHPLFFTEDE